MGITKYSIQPSSIDHFIINSWAGMNFNAVIIDIPEEWGESYIKWDPEKRCIVR